MVAFFVFRGLMKSCFILFEDLSAFKLSRSHTDRWQCRAAVL